MRKILCITLIFCLLALPIPAQAASAGPTVKAKSAIVMDAATGTVLLEQNSHEKLPPASVTKVMTMLLIMEAIESGRIRWEDTVTASETAAAKGGSQIYLKAGETMSVTDMLKSIAVSSANDCACAMAEHIAGSEEAFVALMNEKAAQLGMTDTHFVNCTGLDDDPAAKEHLTCAYDIALMSRELMVKYPKIKEFTTIWMDTVRDGAFGLSNTNKMVRFYKGATGLKTGFTAAAGYCLSATAQRDGMELIAVVLGAESSQDRFNGCRQLLDHGFANYALVRPEAGESRSVPVTLGKSGSVDVVPGEDVSILVEKGQLSQVQIRVELEEIVAAPVSKGQRLGTMTVTAGQQVLRQIPMLAAEGVQKKSFWDILTQLLRRMTMQNA